MSNLALNLIEGSKRDRDQYIGRLDVLDKVKELITLPSLEYTTTQQLADYYDVSAQTIRTIRNRHKDEFECDGVRTLKSEGIKELKEKMLSFQAETIKTKAYLTIFPRKAVLRMGMLLTESLVAEQIRDYLLDVEQESLIEQRNGVIKYTGEWTPEIERYVLENMNKNINDGMKTADALHSIANKVGINIWTLKARWYGGSNYNKALKDKKVQNIILPTTLGNNVSDEILNKLSDIIESNNKLLLEKINGLEEENGKLYKGLGSLWRLNKSICESLDGVKNQNVELKKEMDEFKNFVEDAYITKISTLEKDVDNLKRKLKIKSGELQKANSYIAKITLENEPVQSAKFKMDRNGNLEKIK